MLERHRLLETLSMLMIGDGVLAAAAPRRHTALWATSGRFGHLMRWCAARPDVVRALGLVESGLGLWLAQRQWRRAGAP